MRQYKTEIRDKMAAYLMEELNLRAEELGLDKISHVETGITSTPGVSSASPILYLFIGARNLSQDFFDSYTCRMGICFGCGTPQDGEATADLWEDAIEDVFRKDRGLGDSCLMWANEPTIMSVGEPGIWMTTCDFDVEYDLGGDV